MWWSHRIKLFHYMANVWRYEGYQTPDKMLSSFFYHVIYIEKDTSNTMHQKEVLLTCNHTYHSCRFTMSLDQLHPFYLAETIINIHKPFVSVLFLNYRQTRKTYLSCFP
jgi:hypothetical protein